MAYVDRQQAVLGVLQDLRNLDGLKKLFWEELNYERENKPLSPRRWPDNAKQALAEDPILFASGGEENTFHVVYCRLASPDLKRGLERPVVNQLLRDHPYALFVFSNESRSAWHFTNVKYDEQAEKRRLVRRITVRPGEGLRTAAERMALLDLAHIGGTRSVASVPALEIQSVHDHAFDVEKVTKDFYREIANWYFWALKHVEFPKDAPKEKDERDHISVIRLITRVIFCWFIREKGLIPGTLFDERKLANMLEGFAPDKPRNKESVFYRAILQNLFFATLNTEMDQRGWRREDQNFMAHSLYRHKDCFRDPKAALELFKDIPFLNGGLFECLDRDFGEGARPRYLRVDGFSDRPDSQPTVPDVLFFGPEQEVDLSDDYGDKKFRKVRVRGLIDTLSRYKFTIEENTPFDQEVALDPELCGKVFENLLAAYNPETGTTARKATGSFYTPREIVDYMVDESLVAYFKGKIEPRMDANGREVGGSASTPTESGAGGTAPSTDVESRLRALLAYDSEPNDFSEAETEALIDAIDGLKALDPAVGSGAFPMGILHKLVLALEKLDPGNERWKAKQIAKLDDAVMREEAERVFRENYDNYGRKLYLIENCIYGVDIQPIAVQIAKMRFFISLIVDQKVNPQAPNLGVRALPNLETRFVAANTLIGIERPKQMLLRNPEIDSKEAELRKVREKHFTAKTLKAKSKCRDDDKKLRAEIAGLLKTDGWDNTTARQLAAWDPYDQNTSAPFFDPEWMFGMRGGFHVVIGNPPYGLVGSSQQSAKAYYTSGRFKLTAYKTNLYVLFIERGLELQCAAPGMMSFIIPKSLVFNAYFETTRRQLLDRFSIPLIVEIKDKVFESGEVGGSVLFFACGHADAVPTQLEYRVLADVAPSKKAVSVQRHRQTELAASPGARFRLFAVRLPEVKYTLGDLWDVNNGLNPGNVRHILLSDSRRTSNHRKLLLGRDLQRYVINWSGTWVNYDPSLKDRITLSQTRSKKGMPAQSRVDFALRDPSIFQPNKVMVRKTADHIVASLDTEGFCFDSLSYGMLPKKSNYDARFLLGLLNSRPVGHMHTALSQNEDKAFAKVLAENLRRLPMPDVDLGSARDRADYHAIVDLVEYILAAKKADPAADTSAWEGQIDEIVYRLYGLTEEEIRIVEGGG
ncbi:MAG: N-6 DNA methylase [Phycisphaerae bacterium]|nr:N-6 DNA methylase [Phycisphaerae bacterium]